MALEPLATTPIGELVYGGRISTSVAPLPPNAVTVQQTLLTATIPSYLYVQYSDDPDLRAFVNAYNNYSQSFVDWFNNINLPIYTGSLISGQLLDWVGAGLYGIPRPVLSSLSQRIYQGYGESALGTRPIGERIIIDTGTAAPVSDDLYKRILTWHLYKGDGIVPSILWLKSRVARFIYGANGADPGITGRTNINITISSGAFTITVPNTLDGQLFQQVMQNGLLALPLQNTYTVALA